MGAGLVLAGTSEAREICHLLASQEIRAIASMAGVTRRPQTLHLPTRTGGFGGAAGFKAYLSAQKISWVLDATHPFAVQMSQTAASLCSEQNIPYLMLQRAPWTAQSQDQWHMIDDVSELPALIPEGHVVFLGTGRQTLMDYHILQGRRLICRVIDGPIGPFPFENGKYAIGTPPFSLEEEVDFLRRENVDWLVVKNAGGDGGRAKLDAARQLNLPVAMYRRKSIPSVRTVSTVRAALGWIKEQGSNG
ncbi:precorrin-6A reductase [Amylibacter marinus]|uniref:Precorrin-6A reductase n=2 Tax=Amylibacter marinus TaxID=1475483 RepID=A0ABQ5VSA0_9RHOB|nr:precorrin-6A reductase [Amylibacter marinus]